MSEPRDRRALSLMLLALAAAGCSPKTVVTAPVNAAGSVVRTAAPIAAGAAVGVATANPGAGAAAGRAVSGAVQRSATPAEAASAPNPATGEAPR